MPKIIKDAKETILQCARYHILENHDEKLSLRQIAKECGIAVGTIYNYFPDKTSLLVAVMVKDWRMMVLRLDDVVMRCETMQEGIFGVYDALFEFKQMYDTVFSNFTKEGGKLMESDGRHIQLRRELEERVQFVLRRFDQEEALCISCLLTETIMTCSVQKDLNKEMLWQYVSRLFEKRG